MPLDPAAERRRARRANPTPDSATVALRPAGFFIWALFWSALLLSLLFVLVLSAVVAAQHPERLAFAWGDALIAILFGLAIGYLTIVFSVVSFGMVLAQWTNFARSLQSDFAQEVLTYNVSLTSLGFLLPVRRTPWTARVEFFFWLGLTPPLGLWVGALLYGLVFRFAGQWSEPINLVLLAAGIVIAVVLVAWGVRSRVRKR